MGSTTYGGITRAGNSGSYTYSVKSGFGDKPVNYVTFWDAARFTNWLTSGNTEVGVYNLGGTTSPGNAAITRDTAAWADGGVAVASENEWYKAAYYDGDTDSYWLYAHQSDSITTTDANYNGTEGTMMTDVGTYSNAGSYYGTFDQGGNVWEWNDTIVDTTDRVLRGGSFPDDDNFLQSSERNIGDPTGEVNAIGFRVTSLAPIPEPSAYAAIIGCLALAIVTVRRKGRRTL